MISTIVFDMGKVLLDYEPIMPCLRHTHCHRENAQMLKQAIFDCEEWVQLDGDYITEAELIQAATQRLTSPALQALVPEIMKDWHLDTLWPIRGMAEIVEEIYRRGAKLYILSNASLRFRAFQYKIPHLEYFSGILVSAEEKLLKPDPAIYCRLLEKFALKPEECLFIDDNQQNVEGAQSVGMNGYWHRNMDVEGLRKRLESL